MDWHEIALAFLTDGLSAPQITHKLIDNGFLCDIPYRIAYDRVRKYINRHKMRAPKVTNVVVQNFEPPVHADKWNGKKHIKFALMGDTQINSKYTQLTHLYDFYNQCARLGVSTVYHLGDIDDGDQMRVGHQYELYNVGADAHVDEIVRVYPKIDGIVTKFICGNHDASIYKRSGCDIGKAIAARRDDMIYLGRDCARVQLTPKCTLELRHPWDGTSYSLSYKLQKMIDAMDFDDKPDILAVGHYHKMEQIYYKNIYAFQTGCFQSATPFTIGKGLTVSMGGWIIEAELNEDGTLNNLTSRFIPYKKAIKNDYANYLN